MRPHRKSRLERFIAQLPGVRTLSRYLRRHHTGHETPEMFPRGHFFSPLPDYQEVKSRAQVLFSKDVDLGPDIQLRSDAQVALLNDLAHFYQEFDWPEQPRPDYRFHLANSWFSHGDAVTLYALLRYLRPKRVVEVGSGFSSALMLDTNERFLEQSVHFTLIEPFPERLLALLRDEDRPRVRLVQDVVQRTPIATFAELDSDDILFIDSSHVSKIGSDVNYLLFEVLPALRLGVVVHFHDIFWPFEYPQTWVLEGRAWNEAYVLRAFLQYSETFEILLFNSYLGYKYASILEKFMPRFRNASGVSLWLRKRRAK